MSKIIEKLSTYGEVKTCKVVADNTFILSITKGFRPKGTTVFDILSLCKEEFVEHTVLETCITDRFYKVGYQKRFKCI